MAPLSGWKQTAVYLTGLVTTLTTFLLAVFFVSLFALKKDHASERTDALGQSLLFEGNCDMSYRISLWVHLAINIVGTGVLASSNYFMQSLAAPTRREIDKQHAAGRWAEIGVQSIRNFGFLGWRKILFWSLFSLSSVPLHLIFNGCVLESKGTNGFAVLLGAESLTSGGWDSHWSIASAAVEAAGGYTVYDSEGTLKHIHKSLKANETDGNWVPIGFDECMKRYNSPETALTHWRHVIMVMYPFPYRPNATSGWKPKQVLQKAVVANMTDTDVVNPLWAVDYFIRTGRPQYRPDWYLWPSNGSYGYISDPGGRNVTIEDTVTQYVKGIWPFDNLQNVFDVRSGLIVMDYEYVRPEYRVMLVDHCVSEKYEAPCRVSIANSLLLIVCIMCVFKCVLCFLVLKFRVWGNENPLMTTGDAIASFIARPDEETKGMCTLTLDDLKRSRRQSQAGPGAMAQRYMWLQGPRQWQAMTNRRFGKAIPLNIWVLSSFLIGSSLVVASAMLGIAIRGQPLGDSRFGHAPQNEDVENKNLQDLPLTQLTMVANLPQLFLSICYVSYNGLFTRMLAEFEWSKYSIEFRALRVTDPKGKQNSTYRLQLPYRFSIPLIIVSILLHWIYANCIYVSNYEAYNPQWPYDRIVTVGLQFSSKAILIAFVVSIGVAITPIFLAFVKLSGTMVIAGANSAVISAACHCPSTQLESFSRAPSILSREGSEYGSMSTRLIRDEETEELEALARKKVKWGRVSTGKSDDIQVGHLSFGTEEHEITKPADGEHYSGI
ncbi:hypothetical protein FNYG_14948 [Fusarium nygamai]|uniref:DUF6536 domain-containing protein n=1 Tax=Gibberella nygamai TaxID=42673 RepID=A0A2K0UNC6_GIBNY|nr:hypothetical protein FNYG_14948 [Fusarium nygamai]